VYAAMPGDDIRPDLISHDCDFRKSLREGRGCDLEDALVGTSLAPVAAELGVWVYVIRGFAKRSAVLLHDEMATALEKASAGRGPKLVRVGKQKHKGYYSMQCTLDPCTCQYAYEGTADHPTFRLETIPPLRELLHHMETLYEDSGYGRVSIML